jgi:hypothetical protein
MLGRRLSTDFVDQAGSAVLEALDADESTSQGEGRSVSRGSRSDSRQRHVRRADPRTRRCRFRARAHRPSAS